MRARTSSPARSEGGLDISGSLFSGVSEDRKNTTNNSVPSLDKAYETILSGLDQASNEADISDENLIAQQQAAANRKASNLKGRTVKKGGGFQAMGLNLNLLKAINRKGFSVPTPIQRKTIPLLLSDKDVVGMARTGSGKTAAFVIPLVEKLKTHSTKMGARALIMAPSRELALQTLLVVKDLSRGTDLRSVLLVGGDSLEEQFAAMTSNPDVVIATPGRFLHLKVEMGLDLSSIKYVVFDEADRLFEMGFAAQLSEILHALSASRQTLLFSATLPKSLVEFARAGLQEPVLVRLDADSKISPDLQNAFFAVKTSEKEGALLHLLQDVIQLPSSSRETGDQQQRSEATSKKRKRHQIDSNSSASSLSNPYSTIIFTATKHHVEYLAQLLRHAGFAVSHVYGSLDQTARMHQIQAFRSGHSNILVVTDVAARGIDIPILANVINYDFPSQPKVFIHRVGRTARAGNKGWSYSIVNEADAPYFLDLQLFLGRTLRVGRDDGTRTDFAEDMAVGSLQRDVMQASAEWVTQLLETDADVSALRGVAVKAEKQYQRTRNAAATESVKRARALVASSDWAQLHSLFGSSADDAEVERERMLERVGGFRPQESIFEIGARRGGKKANEEAIGAIRKIRHGLEKKKQRTEKKPSTNNIEIDPSGVQLSSMEESLPEVDELDVSMASDSELEVSFSQPHKTAPRGQLQPGADVVELFRDKENFMSYNPADRSAIDDHAYGVHSGSTTNFAEAARRVTMDLALDEAAKGFGEARGVMRWDKRHKRYVARQNDEDGSKGKRLVRGESGAKIAASFRSGRYDAWQKANRFSGVKLGQKEGQGNPLEPNTGKRYKHQSLKKPKNADKYRDDYEKRKKKIAEAQEKVQNPGIGKELRNVDDIRKQRNLKEKRRSKNARPARKRA